MQSSSALVAGASAILCSLAVFQGTAQAAALVGGLGGPRGYGTTSVFRNDDSGVGPVPLPFALNFYGNTYSQYFVNTNGNITFQSVLGDFTPTFFPGAPQPIIAPYWADVDTRENATTAPGSTGDDGLVWYTSPDPDTVVVTWNNVGYFSEKNPPSNDFQLILRNDAGLTGTPGDFTFEFRYNDLNWTTGDASGGVNGLGGIAAVAGFDAGNGTNFAVLPGSRTPDVLNLVNISNVNEPGVWRTQVRNGFVPDNNVPGPLSLLGVGAGLAWSRRLRSRIQGRG